MVYRPGWWGARLLDTGSDDSIWARAGERQVTRGELRRRVTDLADSFRGQGIGSGSTIALQLPPSWTLLWSMLALWSCWIRG